MKRFPELWSDILHEPAPVRLEGRAAMERGEARPRWQKRLAVSGLRMGMIQR